MTSNRAIVERFIEIVNSHNFKRLREVVAEDYVQHNPHAEQGLMGLIAFFEGQLRSLPELKGGLQILVSEGDYVAAKTTVSGKKDGQPHQTSICDFWRVREGKLVEHW